MPSAMSLEQLRALLHSRIDPAADWESALLDAAARARVALAASRALIGLPMGDGQWRAYLDSGQQVSGTAVSLVASTTVLDRATREGLVRECIDGPALHRSISMDRQHIHSVIAVALARHGADGQSAPLGVLYLDRREELPGFGVDEEQWARDFAAVSERLLTLIELLARARRERDAALADNDALRSEQFGAELDVLDSRDPTFQDHVGRVLSKAAKADRITVLLQGPTGSGKTHLARRFHALSRRRDRAFVTLIAGKHRTQTLLLRSCSVSPNVPDSTLTLPAVLARLCLPTAAFCSLMRSTRCRWSCSRGCCDSWNPDASPPWARGRR